MLNREIYFSEVVDHLNGDKADNRRCNLRLGSYSDNSNNISWNPRNLSGYKGVCWDREKKRWCGAISIQGKRKYLGLFKDPVDAARAYDRAASQIGRLNLNFPT